MQIGYSNTLDFGDKEGGYSAAAPHQGSALTQQVNGAIRGGGPNGGSFENCNYKFKTQKRSGGYLPKFSTWQNQIATTTTLQQQ